MLAEGGREGGRERGMEGGRDENEQGALRLSVRAVLGSRSNMFVASPHSIGHTPNNS